MSSFYDDASLVMIPSCYKTSTVLCEKPTDGSGDLTFTRTGDTATRVNSSGLVEKVRTNLTLYSQDLTNAAYISGGTGSVVRTGNYAAAPDGTNTATRIQITRGATYQELYQRITGLTVGDEYTLSFYAKSLSGTPTLSTAFNNGYANEVTFTSSWVRYTYTFIVAPTGRAGLNLLTLGGGTSTTADILIWGVQLESGVATAYIPTTTAAVSVGPVANLARLDYLGSTCPKLQLEPSRINIQLNSENFSQSNWSKTNSAVVTNQVASPDGYVNASKLNETAVNNIHQLESSRSVSSSTAYTMSVFAKKAERSWIRIYEDTTLNSAYFNLDSGTVGTVGGPTAVAKIENYGNGWYRCSVTYTETGTFGRYRITTAKQDNEASYLGVANNGIYVWGAQYEAGAYATSYIPTLGAAVTRGADACTKTGIGSLFGSSYTLFGEYVNQGVANTRLLTVKIPSGGNYDNFITIFQTGTGLTATGNDASSVAQFSIASGSYSVGQTLKFALRCDANNVAFYINGVQIGTDNTATIPAVTALWVGNYVDVIGRSVVNQVLTFPTPLSNSDLAALTA